VRGSITVAGAPQDYDHTRGAGGAERSGSLPDGVLETLLRDGADLGYPCDAHILGHPLSRTLALRGPGNDQPLDSLVRQLIG
jgi:hypothetical protein